MVEDLDGETLVYDVERHRAHCLNGTAAHLWRHCNGRRSTADLTRRLVELLGPGVLNESNVKDALRRLYAVRLIEAPIERRPKTVSGRRQAMTRLARLAGSAALLPVIVSIVAPTAAQAASCKAIGTGPCTAPAQCCANSQGNSCCQGGVCTNGQGSCV